jgi:hypothetical protein
MNLQKHCCLLFKNSPISLGVRSIWIIWPGLPILELCEVRFLFLFIYSSGSATMPASVATACTLCLDLDKKLYQSWPVGKLQTFFFFWRRASCKLATGAEGEARISLSVGVLVFCNESWYSLDVFGSTVGFVKAAIWAVNCGKVLIWIVCRILKNHKTLYRKSLYIIDLHCCKRKTI